MPTRLLVLSPSRGFLSLCAEGAGSGRPALALGSASAAGAGSDWQPVGLTALSRFTRQVRRDPLAPILSGRRRPEVAGTTPSAARFSPLGRPLSRLAPLPIAGGDTEE